MTRAGGLRALLVCCCALLLPPSLGSAGKRGSMNDFVFTCRSRGGPEIADGLAERESILRVEGRRGIATYEQHRSESDSNGEPIGRFEAPLDPTAFGRLRSVLDTGILDQLGPTSGGSFSSSLITYGFEAGGKHVQKVLSSGDHDQLTRLGPLEDVLNGILPVLFQHPRAALRVDVRRIAETGGERFELVLVDIGTEAIEVANPRTLTDHPGSRAFVEIAAAPPEKPGVTPPPLRWATTLRLEPVSAGTQEPRRLRLAPGAAQAYRTETWHHTVTPGADYLVRAVFESYGDTPAAEPAAVSAYLVRGAVRSEVLELLASDR
jgi:hypothetical protein